MNNQTTGGKNEMLRMDALTDGVFAIVATLLVLEIKLPALPENYSKHQLSESLLEVVPSFLAFAFSFLTVIIYWINHDHLSNWLKSYNQRVKYLNLLLIFFICLIPFPTKFISEYPTEQVSVMTYGIEFFMVAVTANIFFYYIAFKADLLYKSVSHDMRKRFAKKIAAGPVLYALSTVCSFIHVYISIGLFILIPLLFLFLPRVELMEEE